MSNNIITSFNDSVSSFVSNQILPAVVQFYQKEKNATATVEELMKSLSITPTTSPVSLTGSNSNIYMPPYLNGISTGNGTPSVASSTASANGAGRKGKKNESGKTCIRKISKGKRDGEPCGKTATVGDYCTTCSKRKDIKQAPAVESKSDSLDLDLIQVDPKENLYRDSKTNMAIISDESGSDSVVIGEIFPNNRQIYPLSETNRQLCIKYKLKVKALPPDAPYVASTPAITTVPTSMPAAVPPTVSVPFSAPPSVATAPPVLGAINLPPNVLNPAQPLVVGNGLGHITLDIPPIPANNDYGKLLGI